MKHTHLFFVALLALLLAACMGSETVPTAQYPAPGDPAPTQIIIVTPTPFAGPLTVTINITGELTGDWSGWRISDEVAPEFLEANCVLYKSAYNNSVWEQWTGKCLYSNISGILSLPWSEDTITAVVEDVDGRFVAMYGSEQ